MNEPVARPSTARLVSTALTVLSDRGVPPPPGVTGTTGNLIQSVFQLDATNTTNGQTTNTFNAPVTLAIVVPALGARTKLDWLAGEA